MSSERRPRLMLMLLLLLFTGVATDHHHQQQQHHHRHQHHQHQQQHHHHHQHHHQHEGGELAARMRALYERCRREGGARIRGNSVRSIAALSPGDSPPGPHFSFNLSLIPASESLIAASLHFPPGAPSRQGRGPQRVSVSLWGSAHPRGDPGAGSPRRASFSFIPSSYAHWHARDVTAPLGEARSRGMPWLHADIRTGPRRADEVPYLLVFAFDSALAGDGGVASVLQLRALHQARGGSAGSRGPDPLADGDDEQGGSDRGTGVEVESEGDVGGAVRQRRDASLRTNELPGSRLLAPPPSFEDGDDGHGDDEDDGSDGDDDEEMAQERRSSSASSASYSPSSSAAAAAASSSSQRRSRPRDAQRQRDHGGANSSSRSNSSSHGGGGGRGRGKTEAERRRRADKRRPPGGGHAVGGGPPPLTACARRHLTVDFADIGWDKWIISPKAYLAHYCAGTCDFPMSKGVRPTNHATIQSVMRAVGLVPGLPGPCCVPDKMTPLSILYVDQADSVVLKLYPNMSVESCACR